VSAHSVTMKVEATVNIINHFDMTEHILTPEFDDTGVDNVELDVISDCICTLWSLNVNV